ncbi:hypothetical protein HED60_23120 [Planctomycetales bacterium ZRK34]|nr:hypothetical protein HED60_23120 [Planctomycetales bacterium ZRK34]
MTTAPNNTLFRLAAFATMLVDHVGIFLLPAAWPLRLIGRTALPWFACSTGYAFTHYTRSQAGYIRRLLILAVITQPIYCVAFDTMRLNVVFTLAGGLIASQTGGRLRPMMSSALFLCWLLESYTGVCVVDGGPMGVLMTAASAWKCWPLAAICAAAVNMRPGFPVYSVLMSTAAAASVVAFVESHRLGLSLGRWARSKVWYWFYPAHLGVLWLIS